MYNQDFFEHLREGSRRSAWAILPIVLGLIRPKRVVDVGCGVGSWLAVCHEHGVDEVLGIDGDHVDRRLLEVPSEEFLAWDLRKPLYPSVRATFDLALSLEVAEHLPPECAATFIDSLVALAPAVLFSAAVPHQTGTGHRNEQWPEYWAEMFAARGYDAIDCVRKRVWRDPAVEWWYAQNTLLYVRRERVADDVALERESAATARNQLALVHPRLYLWTLDRMGTDRVPARQLLTLLLSRAAAAIRRRIAKRRDAETS
jgi:SAM-dependent methyltransferase